MKAIVMLREAGIHVKINGSLVKENQGDYARILEIAKELDCAVNIDTHMQPAVRERSKPFDQQSRMDPEEAAIACMEIHHLQDSEEEYLARIHRIVNSVEEADQKTTEPIGITCLAARCSFTINWQGKMRPCVMMPGPEVDVFEKGFASGWESMNTECRNIYLNEKCFACQYRFICSTCVASAYHETGEYTGLPDYVCRYAKAMYEKAKDDRLMYQKKHNTK